MGKGERWEPRTVENTPPCSYPDAETTIRAFYALPEKRREGTFQEMQFDDLMKAHAVQERCPHCLMLIQQLSTQEKIDAERGRF